MTNKPNLPLNVLFVAVSANAKTGTIPVTYSPEQFLLGTR